MPKTKKLIRPFSLADLTTGVSSKGSILKIEFSKGSILIAVFKIDPLVLEILLKVELISCAAYPLETMIKIKIQEKAQNHLAL